LAVWFKSIISHLNFKAMGRAIQIAMPAFNDQSPI
jgi:hypothetical protein